MGIERRRSTRYGFRLDARIQAVGPQPLPSPIETITHDISSKGLLLEMDQPLEIGSRIQVTLDLPAEVVGRPVQLRCISRIVRLEPVATEGKIGVGAQIERYEFMPLEDVIKN